MGRYDKFSVHKINRIMQESKHNAELAQAKPDQVRPKARAISADRGHLQIINEMQGE